MALWENRDNYNKGARLGREIPTLSSGGQAPWRICIKGSWFTQGKQWETETHSPLYPLLWFPLSTCYTTSDAHSSFVHHTKRPLTRLEISQNQIQVLSSHTTKEWMVILFLWIINLKFYRFQWKCSPSYHISESRTTDSTELMKRKGTWVLSVKSFI